MAQVSGENVNKLLEKISTAIVGEPIGDAMAAMIVISMVYQLGSELSIEEIEESVKKISRHMSDLAEEFYKRHHPDVDLENLKVTSNLVN